MQDLKTVCLKFLHKWVEENKIPHIRKGMTDDLERLIVLVQSETELKKSAERMMSGSETISTKELEDAQKNS